MSLKIKILDKKNKRLTCFSRSIYLNLKNNQKNKIQLFDNQSLTKH